jgi:hypothetical protein
MLAFKKGNKTISKFWEENFIAFQLKNKEWRKGEITKIQNDSFYIRPMIVKYGLYSSDTFHYSILGFAFSDVYAMPKKGYLIDYVNGRFQISKSGGHVHWYWVKSGWVFRVGAAGYSALNIINGLIKNNLTLKDGRLAIAAGVFVFGVLLKHIYRPTLRIRKKYHFEIVDLSNKGLP